MVCAPFDFYQGIVFSLATPCPLCVWVLACVCPWPLHLKLCVAALGPLTPQLESRSICADGERGFDFLFSQLVTVFASSPCHGTVPVPHTVLVWGRWIAFAGWLQGVPDCGPAGLTYATHIFVGPRHVSNGSGCFYGYTGPFWQVGLMLSYVTEGLS